MQLITKDPSCRTAEGMNLVFFQGYDLKTVVVSNDEDFRYLSRVKYFQDPNSGELTFEPFYKA